MARQAFFSFHYQPDNWRASQVRNIGVIEGNRPATDNDWESITKTGDASIKKWIDDQMNYRSCTVVLVGSNTAGRKWINYEIETSWNKGMGVLGIHIHRLKDRDGYQSYQGNNPFFLYSGGRFLTEVVKLYDPPYIDSKDVYRYIADNMAGWAEDAVKIRQRS
jgi:hypothetical protein